MGFDFRTPDVKKQRGTIYAESPILNQSPARYVHCVSSLLGKRAQKATLKSTCSLLFGTGFARPVLARFVLGLHLKGQVGIRSSSRRYIRVSHAYFCLVALEHVGLISKDPLFHGTRRFRSQISYSKRTNAGAVDFILNEHIPKDMMVCVTD